MKYAGILVLLVLMGSVFALNQTDVNQIKGAIVPTLQSETKNQTFLILEEFDEVPRNVIELLNQTYCSKINNLTLDVNANGNLSLRLQKALEDAMDNKLDEKNQDLQAYIQETLLPQRQQFDVCENDARLAQRDFEQLQFRFNNLNQTYLTFNETMHQRVAEAEDGENFAWMATIGISILAVILNMDLVRKIFGQEVKK